MTTSPLQMSLADVARLAGVARPVASVWRSRPAPGRPFPRSVSRHGQHDRFDAFEVVDYLQATGRGNTVVERADVAAHAKLAQVGGLDEEAVFAGLSALLVLGAERGESLVGLDQQQLLDLARESDPQDGLIVRELIGVRTHLADLAAHADALADASYSSRAAFELLLQQQITRSLHLWSASQLRLEASVLVGRLAAELAADAGWEAPLLVAPFAASGDLLLQAARQYASGVSPTVAVTLDDSPEGRLLRRRLRVHDLHQLTLERTRSDDLKLPAGSYDGSVHLVQVPAPGDGKARDVDVLDTLGDLVVQLAPDSRVVAIGPATALTDRPSSPEADRARDAVLRGGRLRAAIRLPAGLLWHAPRQHLAVWVLGPAHADVPVADRWTVVGDLTGAVLDTGTTDDLVTDVLASLADPRQVDTHAYRFAHRVLTSALIPRGTPLVDTRSPVVSTGRGHRTMDDLVSRRNCRIIPGNRVDPAHLQANGRRVIGPAELLGEVPVGSRAVDPLTFPAAYPASRYTEPGDVIFCTSPRPTSLLDRDGGTVVLAPARALRIVPDADDGMPDLTPEVVAADVNGAAGRDWRRWTIRLVPRERQDALTKELTRIDTDRRELQARLARLDHQATQAIDHATAPREEGR